MALDYKSVLDIYDASREGGLTDKSLPDWSQEMNTKTGTELYSAGLHDNIIKRGSARLDKLIEATGIPEYGAAIGRDVGSFVGDEAAGEQVGRGLGRMAVNVAPLLIPGVGWGATAARLGGTALLSGAETYTETGSPAAGLLSGATMAALPGVATKAEQFALRKLGARPLADLTGQLLTDPYRAETTKQAVGSAIAGQVAAAGLFGVSGAGQELLAGETPSSPFTTANLLSLTLGQAPFAAAHLGGRALRTAMGGETAAMRKSELTKALNLSDAAIKLRAVKKEMDDRPPLKDQPDVLKPTAEELTPEQYEVARQIRLTLSRVRGEMIDVKNDPTLTDEQRVNKTNDLMNQEFATLRERETALATTDTIFGNRIEPDAPRQDLIGTQLRINRNGTWRAIHVADDPFNPEELRGKVISYSAVGAPPPVFGLQSEPSLRYGGTARFSLPDPQWWTVKSKEEWDVGGRKGDVKQEPVPWHALDADEKDLLQGRLSATLEKKGKIEFTDIPTELSNKISTTDAAVINRQFATNPKNAIDALTRTRETQPDLPVQEDVMSPERLSAHLRELEDVRNNVDAANTTGDIQQAVTQLNDVQHQNDLKPTNDGSLKTAIARLVNAGVPQDEAIKAAVKAATKRTGRMITEKQLGVLVEGGFKTEDIATMTPEQRKDALAATRLALKQRGTTEVKKEFQPTEESVAEQEAVAKEELKSKLTPEEYSKVVKQFGGGGVTIIDSGHVSHGASEDLEVQPLSDLTTDAAFSAVRDPSVKAAFDPVSGHSLEHDIANFVDVVENLGDAKDPAKVAELTGWPLEEATDFVNRPHVKAMGDALNMTLTNMQRSSEAPIAASPVTLQPRVEAGKGFFFALPSLEEFQQRLRGSIPKSGLVPVDLFQKKGGLRKDQPLSKGEMELMRNIVPEAFQGNAVHVEALVNGLKEKGPVVETKVLSGESSGSISARERAQMQHGWYDNLPENVRKFIDAYTQEYIDDPNMTGVQPNTTLNQAVEAMHLHPSDVEEFKKTAFRWAEISDLDYENRGSPQYSFVAPKPEAQMPGYVEGLVRIPRTSVPPKTDLIKAAKARGKQVEGAPLYVGPHFGAEDTNVVAFFRGYEETLPNGEKAFHVIEVQSDWGQQVRDRNARRLAEHERVRRALEADPNDPYLQGAAVGQGDIVAREEGHPLLEVYNSLALKAAIQHAKEIGATKVILSDAKTAMMTEGHDRYADVGGATGQIFRNAIIPPDRLAELRPLAESQDLQVTDAGHVYEENRGISERVDQFAREHGLETTLTGSMGQPLPERYEPPQAKGMRLNYDQVLPSAMEKLTGDKGQEVDLGTHKAAYGRSIEQIDRTTPPEGSPVFKDEQGNPKTNITGRVYDITQAGPEFSLFGAREAPVAGAKVTGAPRHNAPPWLPTEQRDVDTMANMGLGGDGKSMLGFVANTGHPLLTALAKDLAKFGPSLERIFGGVYDIGSGAFVKTLPGGKFEIRLSPGILRAHPTEAGYTLAHELVHGLTLAELHNPTKAGFNEAFNSLRGRLIGALPDPMRRAANDAINSDWYSKWSRREVTLESLYPQGTDGERSVLYSLLNNDELISGGLTGPATQRFMRTVKSEGKPWYSKFANLIKATLGLGDRVGGTAWEEFLSHTHGLMDRGSHVADFRNYSNRYFENLGQSETFVRSNTQRAMGLILSNLGEGHGVEDVLQRIRLGAGSARSPEWVKANQDAAAMFAEKGDDFQTTRDALVEAGHLPDQMGLADFADSVMSGTTPVEHLDVMPERAARLVFETAKDASNLLGAIRGATTEGNKGLLNIAEPTLLHNLSKQTLASVEKVLEQNKLHDLAVKDLQDLFAMPPDGFQDKMVNSPDQIPPEFMGEDRRSMYDHIENFIAPATQIARGIPEAAEAFSRGRQLHANQRKMATEAQKPFGMDLETMELSSESVKNTARTFEQPRLTKAADKWIHLNQVVGDRTGEVRVLDVEDPRVQDILSGLNAKDKDTIEDIVNKQSISTQFVQSETLEKRLQIGTIDGAVIAQAAEGGKLRDAVAKSEQLLRAFVADRTDPVAARTADAQIAEVQAKMSLEGFQKLASFTETVAGGWKAQQELFQKNPAWASGQRHGKFLMEFTKGGKAQLRGVESRKEAEVIAEGKPFKLTPNRQEDADRPPFMGFGSSDTINRLRDFDQQYIDHMRSSGAFTPDQIELMKRYSPIEQFTTEQVYRGGVRGVEPQPRRLTKGAEDLPWLENHFAFINKTSNYWSRQLFRAQARAHLLDPEVKSNPDLHGKLENYYDNLLTPDTALGHFLTRSAVTWFMGYNPASALVNATQPFMTHVAEFTRLTGKPFNSYTRVLSGLKEVITHAKTGKWSDPEITELVRRATQDGFVDNSMYDDNAAAQETVATKLKQILARQRPQTTGQRLGTLAGSFSNVGMWMFRTVERMNNMSALISSYKFYRESQPNLGRNELYEKAVQFNEAVNYGGGPAARPIGLYKAFPRTAAMLATSMQSYNLGSMFQIARYLKEGFFRPQGLTPHEVYSARIAGVQMLATQLGAAGILGLPLASSMLAILNTAFPGLELHRHFREGMDTVLGGDERNGHVLTDIAMTGVPSMMGWDLQSRLSMGNTVPGVSEVNGFQLDAALGAPVNLISNFVKGGIKFVSGDPRGAEAFVPNSLKKIEQLLRSGGQVLDYRDRPVFTPTLGQGVGMALGFQPKQLTDYNAAARMARQTDDNIKRREGEFHQRMAEEVLKGNFGNVRQELQQRIKQDKTYDPMNAVRSIAGSAEELTFPRDLRREGPLAAADPRTKLLSTFNLPATQPSETDRLKFRQNVEQRLGLPVTSSTDLQMATVMDRLRQQQPMEARAELRRQATLLLHGNRPRTLLTPEE